MRSRDLTYDQLDVLKTHAKRSAHYFTRVLERMRLRGIDEADPLYVATQEAVTRMTDLVVALHYTQDDVLKRG